jgi:hypothetical protein
MTKQETILNAIRTACPELKNIIESVTVDEEGSATELELGEPQLEHLLRAIDSRGLCIECNLGVYYGFSTSLWGQDAKHQKFDIKYDLTKSVTENLQDNEELTNSLYKLLTNQ